MVRSKALPPRPKSISEVEGKINSLIIASRLQSASAIAPSSTEARPVSPGNKGFEAGSRLQVGLLAKIQAVTPQLEYAPMSRSQ